MQPVAVPHLVQAARVAVEEDAHGVLEDLARVGLFELALAVGPEVLERLAQERLREVHPEPGRDRRRLVRHAEEVDVREEAVHSRTSASAHVSVWSRRGTGREARAGGKADARLALVDAGEEERVPVRVKLAPPCVHDVAHVLVDLRRRQLVPVLEDRLVRPVVGSGDASQLDGTGDDG